eukprot:jgi/Mesen1/9601/ME000659S08977
MAMSAARQSWAGLYGRGFKRLAQHPPQEGEQEGGDLLATPSPEVDGLEGEEEGDEGAPRSAVGSSAAYLKARTLLNSLAKTVVALEDGMDRREKDLDVSMTKLEVPPTDPQEEESLSLYVAEKRRLQRLLAERDDTVARLNARLLDADLRAQVAEEGAREVAQLRREIEARDQRMAALVRDIQMHGTATEEEESRIKDVSAALHLATRHSCSVPCGHLFGFCAAAGSALPVPPSALFARLISILVESESRVAELSAEVASLTANVAEGDTLLTQMSEEAELSASALQSAARAMMSAQERMSHLEERLHNTSNLLAQQRQANARAQELKAELTQELEAARREGARLRLRADQLEDAVRSKDKLAVTLRQEGASQQHQLAAVRKDAQEEKEKKAELESQLERTRDTLRAEVEASAAALKASAQREHAMRLSEARVRELEAAQVALQAAVDSKERTLAAVREETQRSAEMLMQAAQTRQDLARAQKGNELLKSQVAAVEEQLRSKDLLLADIRHETLRGADALRTATLIKQELNDAVEREAMLKEELERRDAAMADLRRELATNLRAQRAEQATRQLAMRMKDLEDEADTLRAGVAQRDAALAAMAAELERSANTLGAAASDRQAVRSLKARLAQAESQSLQQQQELEQQQQELEQQQQEQQQEQEQREQQQEQERWEQQQQQEQQQEQERWEQQRPPSHDDEMMSAERLTVAAASGDRDGTAAAPDASGAPGVPPDEDQEREKREGSQSSDRNSSSSGQTSPSTKPSPESAAPYRPRTPW